MNQEEKLYPSWPQTFDDYLETMKVYNFYPMTQEQWTQRQIELHGDFNPAVKRNDLTYTPAENNK